MIIDILNGTAAALAFVGYVCRVDVLRFGVHRASVVLMHLGLGSLCIQAVVHAWQGATGLQDVCGILVAVSWLLVSAWSWSGGVPSHAMVQRGRQHYIWAAES